MAYSLLNLAAMERLEANECHNAHVHDGRDVVEDCDDGEDEQLIASIGA